MFNLTSLSISPTTNHNAHQLSKIQSGVQNYQNQQNQQLADIQSGVWEPHRANDKVQPTYAQELPANGVQPLTEDPALDDIAQYRAEQTPASHYDANGNLESNTENVVY